MVFNSSPLAGALMDGLGAASYLWVGRLVLRRRIPGPDRGANGAFGVWWCALGIMGVVAGCFSVAAAFGVADLPLHLVLLHVELVAVFVALWGLAYYLAYLFTGSQRWFWPLAAFYLVLYLVFDYLVVRADPVGVTYDRWQTTLVMAHPEWIEGTPATAMVVPLVAPQIVGSMAYFSLYFRVRQPELRYRIGLVAGGILAWMLSALAASLTGLSRQGWWHPVSTAIGTAVAILVVLAYQPPAWVRRRWATSQPGPASGASS